VTGAIALIAFLMSLRRQEDQAAQPASLLD